MMSSLIQIPKEELRNSNTSLLKKQKKINKKKEAISNHKNEVIFPLLAQLCVGNVEKRYSFPGVR